MLVYCLIPPLIYLVTLCRSETRGPTVGIRAFSSFGVRFKVTFRKNKSSPLRLTSKICFKVLKASWSVKEASWSILEVFCVISEMLGVISSINEHAIHPTNLCVISSLKIQNLRE